VRVGDDVLAARARLATGGRVGSEPLCALGLARSLDQIDWSRAVVDSCSIRSIRAVYGGDQTGPNPTDRAKREQAPSDLRGRGVPLAVRLTGANRNDSQKALALVGAIPPLHGERGRPRQLPLARVRADLLAVAAQDMEVADGHFSGAHPKVAVWGQRVRAAPPKASPRDRSRPRRHP
jgi:hypothetical protein